MKKKCVHSITYIINEKMTFEEEIEYARKNNLLTPFECMQQGISPVQFDKDGYRVSWFKLVEKKWNELTEDEKSQFNMKYVGECEKDCDDQLPSILDIDLSPESKENDK